MLFVFTVLSTGAAARGVAHVTTVSSACSIGFSGNNSAYNGVLHGGKWTGHRAVISYTPDVIGLPGMSSAGSGGRSTSPPVISLSTSHTIDWQNFS